MCKVRRCEVEWNLNQKSPPSTETATMTTIAHITHEAVEKVGGIGAVLQGLLTSRADRESVERSILVGPLFDPSAAQPLGPQGDLLYDRISGVKDAPAARALEQVEREHGVRLVYGRRPLAPGVQAEVLLVDVTTPPRGLAGFKHELYRRFGLTSDRYEADPEYEQYVRLAGPAFDAVACLVPAPSPCCAVAHEFMGLPTAFRSILSADPRFTTLFYAHEVATVRRLIEGSQGQDVMFYNALRAAGETGAGLEEVFGSQDDFYKHALVRRAWHCDKVLAVGDLVMQELAFLGGEFRSDPPLLVYNGVEAEEISPGDRMSARGRLAEFAERLLGFRPDYAFTHVSRLVQSKGLWRDLLVCRALDEILASQGRKAVLIVLATAAVRREPEAVRRMAAEYGWPLVHREGFPDLAGGEEDSTSRCAASTPVRGPSKCVRQPVRHRPRFLGGRDARHRFQRPAAGNRRRVRAVDLRAVRDSPDRAHRFREPQRRQRCLRLPGIPAGQHRRGGRQRLHPRRLHPARPGT